MENGSPDSVGLTTVNSFVTYSCNEGYEPLGGNTVSFCQTDGEWSAVSLACQSKQIFVHCYRKL